MKKSLFLLLVILLSVPIFGQISSKKEINPKICTITIPCTKADSAQAYIERGFFCEKQLVVEQKKTDYYQKIVFLKNHQIDSLLVGAFEKQKIVDNQHEQIIIQASKIKTKNKWLLGLGLVSIVQFAVRL
jgi:hypothetical protein